MFNKKRLQKRTPEEKEKILQDIQKMGIIAGCRQHNISRSQYYDWLEKYTAHGLEGFIISKNKVYRLMKENKLLHPKITRSQNLKKEFIQ